MPLPHTSPIPQASILAMHTWSLQKLEVLTCLLSKSNQPIPKAFYALRNNNGMNPCEAIAPGKSFQFDQDQDDLHSEITFFSEVDHDSRTQGSEKHASKSQNDEKSSSQMHKRALDSAEQKSCESLSPRAGAPLGSAFGTPLRSAPRGNYSKGLEPISRNEHDEQNKVNSYAGRGLPFGAASPSSTSIKN